MVALTTTAITAKKRNLFMNTSSAELEKDHAVVCPIHDAVQKQNRPLRKILVI